MANLPLLITDLDFDSILSNFKNYLKSQDVFQDYNFEGSAISELLRLLSYNTFYNAYYINNVANEMFLDSAIDRSSVVSRAKSLGYIPASSVSSYIYVDLESKITKKVGETPPTSNSFITLNPYATFTTSVNENTYNFITSELNNLYYDSDGGNYWVYKKNNVKIVEGKYLFNTFKVQNNYEHYYIPNVGVDLNSLVVNVYDSENASTYVQYTRCDNMINTVDENSTVYWIYEGIDGKYYLEFGNGTFGKQLTIGNIIYVQYIKTNGNAANGAKSFSIGNYSYSDPTVIDYNQALSITPSVYTILTVDNTTSPYTVDSYVVGLTSNASGYVYTFDNNTQILTLYSSNGTFLFNETIEEQQIFGANTIIGSISTVLTSKNETSTTSGGSNVESIDSIKFNAPKLFASQNRLVTSSDYESIVKHNYPYIDDIVCWGGEDEVPQQLGNVFLAIKPKSRDSLYIWEKNYILQNIIEDKKIISMNVNIVDPDYIYIVPNIDIKYDSALNATTTKQTIETNVKNIVEAYGLVNLNSFNNTFYYSPFCTIIDNANQFILGNDTIIQVAKYLEPLLNIPYTSNNVAVLKYSNALLNDPILNSITSSTFNCNVAITTANLQPTLDYAYTSSNTANLVFSVPFTLDTFYSSQFSCNVDSTLVSNCIFGYSSTNNHVLTVQNYSNSQIIVPNAGTIDYANGIIYFSNVTIHTTELTNSNGALITFTSKPVDFVNCSFELSSSNNSILNVANSSSIIFENAATVDYANGIIYVSNVNISSTSLTDSLDNPIVEIYSLPVSNDLSCNKNQVLKLNPTFNITSTSIKVKK